MGSAGHPPRKSWGDRKTSQLCLERVFRIRGTVDGTGGKCYLSSSARLNEFDVALMDVGSGVQAASQTVNCG